MFKYQFYQQQRMNSNYGRLIEELQELVKDQQVKASLHPSIKMRADRILEQKEKNKIEQLVDEMSRSDRSNLFAPSLEELVQPFQPIFIDRDSSASDKKEAFNARKQDTFHTIYCNSRPLNVRTKTEGMSQKNSSIQNIKIRQSKSKDKILKDIKNFSSNSNCIQKRQISRQKNRSRNNSLSHPKPKQLRQSSTAKKTNKQLSDNFTYINKQKNRVLQWTNKQNQFTTLAHLTGNQLSSATLDSNVQHACFRFSKNKPKTKVSQGREVLEKLATIDTVSSRFSRRNISTSGSKQKARINESLQHHRQQAQSSKQSYEEIIFSLKRKIIDERMHLKTINQNIASMQNQIAQIQNQHRDKQMEIQISRKKSQSFFAETRKIEEKIEITNKNNDIVIDTIAEEQYLLIMYNRVLNEIKSQLKAEQQQTNQLKQQLVVAKYTEKTLRDKFSLTVALSDELFDSMRASLRKQSKTKL